MKKYLFILAIACLLMNAKSVQSQTCDNAAPDVLPGQQSANRVPIPPPGTVFNQGPSLGCLTVTTRQVWFYLPVCESGILFGLIPSLNSSLNDTVGMVLYGPYSEKVSDCIQFNSSKIVACDEEPIINFPYLSVLDSVYSGNFYYILYTVTDTYNSSDSINNVVAINPPGLQWEAFDCLTCNNSISVLEDNRRNICTVSVDTAINKCHIIYDEIPATNMAGYAILRESNLAGVYDSIAAVPIGSLSEYTDMTSSPEQRSYRYAVVGYDSCGNSMSQQKNILTIHLLSFAGGNNTAQLIWNNVYNISAGFEPQYFIYRNNSSTGWQLIDSIGITLQTITYTDIFAPPGINSYTVELRKDVPCVPMRTTSITYQSVFSNVTDVIVTGVDEQIGNNTIHVYPNPANTYLIISGVQFNVSDEIILTDALGKIIFRKKIAEATLNFKPDSYRVQTSNFSNGIYFLQMKMKEGVVNKKVVVEH
jgi:hypothetical protein